MSEQKTIYDEIAFVRRCLDILDEDLTRQSNGVIPIMSASARLCPVLNGKEALKRLEATYERESAVLAKLREILSEPDLMRPDGTPCYCNPDVPNRMEDFGTSSEFGVCDGDGKEVFSESEADALSAVARAQMLLGIANYKQKG